jgi:hypothetical protein
MSETGTSVPTGTIVWFELPSSDTTRAQAFYGSLFGWSFERFGDMDYHASNQAGGAVYNDPSSNGVMAYFGVADVDEAARQVAELGGTAGDKEEIPGVGFYVRCVDLDGNTFGLYQGLVS